MKTLDQIAIEKGTDKSSLGHSYCQYYSIFLDPVRNESIKLLEIGIDSGNSIKMWQEYLPNAEIHGIDIREGYEYLHDGRTFTHVVDQSKKGELIVFAEQYSDYFNVIVCDGSHVAEDDILTFETLFPYLKSGGIYILEDTECSYDKNRWGKNANIYDRIRQMIGEVSMNGKMSNDHICANKKTQAPKYDLNEFEKSIEWIFVSAGATIIKKL